MRTVKHASVQELEERKKEAEERKKEAAELKMLLEIAKKAAATAESTAKKAEDELKKARRRNLPVSTGKSRSEIHSRQERSSLQDARQAKDLLQKVGHWL